MYAQRYAGSRSLRVPVYMHRVSARETKSVSAASAWALVRASTFYRSVTGRMNIRENRARACASLRQRKLQLQLLPNYHGHQYQCFSIINLPRDRFTVNSSNVSICCNKGTRMRMHTRAPAAGAVAVVFMCM